MLPQGHALSEAWCLYSQALKCCSEDDNIHILIIRIELFMYEFFSFLNYRSNASFASMHGTPLIWGYANKKG
jgi:hypothetical protein